MPQVRILRGDWRELREYGPFDLLALDGGGQGKGVDPPLDPAHWLRRGGLVVMDDFAPLIGWPPLFQGETTRSGGTGSSIPGCAPPR